MEIRIEALDGCTPPQDTFVSLRLGDVQKQSRFGSSRTFRFPDLGLENGRYGRIELFKRIGAVTVGLDPAGGLHEVEVPCSLPGAETLGVRLWVKGPGNDTSAAAGPSRKRMDAAQRYIAEHRLEEVLAEAMREVIHHRPGNPHDFLSKQILKHARPVEADATESAAPREPPELRAAPPAASLAEPTSGVRAAGDAPEAVFEHLPSVGSWLCRRSPWRPVPAPTPEASCNAPAAAPARPFHWLPSAATWCLPAPYQHEMPVSAEVAVPGAVQEASPPSGTPDALPPVPFIYRPSVGSWLTRTPFQVPRPWYYREDKGPASARSKELQAVISQREQEIETLRGQLRVLQKPLPVLPAVTAPSQRTQAPAAAGPPLSDFGAYYRAHFGLGGSPAARDDPLQRLYAKFSPKRTPASRLDAELPGEANEQSILSRSASSIASMSPQQLLDAFRLELEKKNREIEELREKLRPS